MTDIMQIMRHIQVTGRVQGVGYRASAKIGAERLGLSGWVCNRRDGSVEITVTGPQTAIENFILWARRGPPDASVTRLTLLDIADAPLSRPSLDRLFEIRPTV